MTLQDYYKKYTFDEVFEQLQFMLEDADNMKPALQKAYDMMQTLQPIPSKKYIRYQIIDDPESEEYFSGAPDSCFTTTWEVILAKEVTIDEECELSEVEMLANAFICSIIMGRCPRAFLPEKRALLGEQ